MMEAAISQVVYLLPGEFCFTGGNTRIHTILGSCVSITLWHPRLHVGGMCHCMLPTRGGPGGGVPDGRYTDEIIPLLAREAERREIPQQEFHVKLFGGGNMFPHLWEAGRTHVGQRNIETARSELEASGFRIAAEDVSGDGHRRLVFDLRNGNVWVKKGAIPAVPAQNVVIPLTCRKSMS